MKFHDGKFAAGILPSHVMVALNEFLFGHDKDLCVKPYVASLTLKGFHSRAESWGDSLFSQAGLYGLRWDEREGGWD